MPLVSMTGFAEAQGSCEGAHWRWEVKSVNGRGLDVRLRLPPGFDSLESAARALAAGRFRRGNVQVSLAYDVIRDGGAFRVDRDALAEAVRLAKEIEAETGLPAARIDGLLSLKGIIVQDDETQPDEAMRKARDTALLESLAEAFAALAASRAGEGAKLARVLSAQVDDIERLTHDAAASAAAQPAILRDRLVAQLDELLAPGAVPADRLAQEVALLASRADVREELDRLAAHVGEARRLMESNEAIGRKLDFLAQEFNREANTLCSKSADGDLTRIGIELKATIDQFREQAANVE
jgi:uncharacterized protein (TIGR00255 family)